MTVSHIVPAEEVVLHAMYDVFLVMLRNRPQVAARMAQEIDEIAERYAVQHIDNRRRPERYRQSKED